MEPPQRDRTTESYKMAEKKAMKLRTEVDAALDWLCRTERECDAGECFVSLDSLVRVGSQHLVALETVVKLKACQRGHWHAGHKDECPCIHLCARDE